MIHLSIALAVLCGQDAGFEEGKRLFEEKKYEEAARVLQPYCEKNQEPLEAFTLLARARLELKQLREALAAFKLAVDAGHDPLKAEAPKEALTQLINGALAVEDPEAKIALLLAVADLFPRMPDRWQRQIDRSLLVAYAKRKDEKNLDVVAERMFAREEGSDPCIAAGMVYLENDVRPEKAIEYLTRGIELYRREPAREQEDPRVDVEAAKQHYVLMFQSILGFAYWRAGKLENPIAAGDAEPGATFALVTDRAAFKGNRSARVAVGDFDGDGWEDVWMGGTIYRNNRGRFETWSKPGEFDAAGALWGDFDNDGAPDLVLFHQPKLRIFRNEGGRFVEKSGLSNLPDFPAPVEGNALVDANGDGLLDIYCAVYESPFSVGRPDHLFLNKGGFVFEDVVMKDRRVGKGVSPADFDNDGQQDIYVNNYRLEPNYFYKCDGKGGWKDVASRLGVRGVEVDGRFGHSIGAAWGDFDGDGDFDLVVSNLAHPRYITFSDKSKVYENLGEAGGWKFADRYAESGIEYEETSADVSACDYDNDGQLDVYFTGCYRERPCLLYRGQGGFKFRRVTWKAGVPAFDGYGHAWLDCDNDGDMDLIVCSPNWGAYFFENRLNPKAGWIQFRLRGRMGGVGARVIVKAGGRTQMREVFGGRGPTSQDSPVQHFGLGAHEGEVEVEVRWLGNRVQKLGMLAPGKRYDLEEPK